MTWRKVHFAKETWLYRVGRSFTVVLEPNGKKHVIASHLILHNVYNHSLARIFEDHPARWAGLTPYIIKHYIHRKLRLGPRAAVPALPDRPSYEAGKEAVLNFLAPDF